jgi:hypothetical protein
VTRTNVAYAQADETVSGEAAPVPSFAPVAVASVKLHQPPANTMNASTNAPSVQLHQTPHARKPKTQSGARPPRLGNYFARKKGAGWEWLEECGYVTDAATGERKRRQPYIARMSRETWEAIRKQHQGAELDAALLEWIEQRKAEKAAQQTI